MAEPRETRLKRLAMRSMRRGTREMDILLSRYVAARLDALDPAGLTAYEALLEEADQDLYQWISGQAPAPAHHAAMVAEIAAIDPAPDTAK